MFFGSFSVFLLNVDISVLTDPNGGAALHRAKRGECANTLGSFVISFL